MDRRQLNNPILVVCRGDGFMEAYAERRPDLLFVDAPRVAIEDEALADEWLRLVLPRRFGRLLNEKRWEVHQSRSLLPSELAEVLLSKDFLGGVNDG